MRRALFRFASGRPFGRPRTTEALADRGMVRIIEVTPSGGSVRAELTDRGKRWVDARTREA